MASASANSSKALCATCNKAKGIFTCDGCSQRFCQVHTIDHRNELEKQLDELGITHDRLQDTFNQKMQNPRENWSFQEIDQWEEESIGKIRQLAKQHRETLFKNVDKYAGQIQMNLRELSDQLKQAREEKDFVEPDLQLWMKKLNELKRDLLNPGNMKIKESSTALIYQIELDSPTVDLFERVCGDATIEENGKLVVKNASSAQTEVRGKKEFLTGVHQLHFRLENFQNGGWIFFGIITKSEPLQIYSYSSPSTYGWSNKKQIWAAAAQSSAETFEAIQNDLIILSIDCDQRKIQLKNQRTNRLIEMLVDTSKCPFPWQFHLNIYYEGTRVRLLHEVN